MTTGRVPKPGDADYISVAESARLQMARNREYEARPDVIRKREEDRASQAQAEVERNAKRKHPKFIQSTDYPWLKPDWVEAPVRPFKQK